MIYYALKLSTIPAEAPMDMGKLISFARYIARMPGLSGEERKVVQRVEKNKEPWRIQQQLLLIRIEDRVPLPLLLGTGGLKPPPIPKAQMFQPSGPLGELLSVRPFQGRSVR
jgi:hypothetical protein